MIVHPQLKHFDKFPSLKQKACELLQTEIQRLQKIQSSSLSSSSSTLLSTASSFTSPSSLDFSQSLLDTSNDATLLPQVPLQGRFSEKKGKYPLSLYYDNPRSSATSVDEFSSWMSSELVLEDDTNVNILDL